MKLGSSDHLLCYNAFAMPNPRYFLQIYGCQMNYSDAERISSLLEELNFWRTEKEAEADLIVVVACSIRQKAVDRIHGKAVTWKKIRSGRRFVTALSGCVLPTDRTTLESVFDIFFDMKDLNSLPEKLSRYFEDLKDPAVSEDHYRIQPKYSSSFQAYVPIATGCNNFCTFCVVPYTRGREKSRPAEQIINEVESLLDRGYKEIVLVGQNVNSYGLDMLPPRLVTSEGSLRFNDRKPEVSFPDLLRRIAQLPGRFWIRFLTSNPQDMSDELLDVVAEEPNCTPYIHLPIQAGDDEMLKRMNRRHTVAHYRELVDKIRARIPGVAITTDVIVGFCGETEAQFHNTLQLFSDVKYDMAYTAQYSHRSGTAAFKAMVDDVPASVKIDREIRLTDVLRQGALERNSVYVGTTQTVLIDKFRNGFNLGKTDTFKTVKIPHDQDLRGRFVSAEITKAEPWGLAGKLINDNVTARGEATS
jgi:tRNA-2-methylthio-N6-dimethylallyladenosine synthase